MNNQITNFAKDNIATGAVMAALFLAIVGNVIDGVDTTEPVVQRMDAIVVSASRYDTVILEPILVVASRTTR